MSLSTLGHDLVNTTTALHLALLPGDVPNPGPGQAPPGPLANGFISLMSWSKWVALGICVLGFIVTGAKMGLFSSNRGESEHHLGAIGKTAVGTAVVTGAYTLVGFFAGS